MWNVRILGQSEPPLLIQSAIIPWWDSIIHSETVTDPLEKRMKPISSLSRNIPKQNSGYIIGILEQRSANCSPWARSGTLPIFVSKVLLECSHVHSLAYYLWLFSHYNGRVEELWQRQYGPQRLKYLLSDLFQNKFDHICFKIMTSKTTYKSHSVWFCKVTQPAYHFHQGKN